jgi:hypothetical protein
LTEDDAGFSALQMARAKPYAAARRKTIAHKTFRFEK